MGREKEIKNDLIKPTKQREPLQISPLPPEPREEHLPTGQHSIYPVVEVMKSPSANTVFPILENGTSIMEFLK